MAPSLRRTILLGVTGGVAAVSVVIAIQVWAGQLELGYIGGDFALYRDFGQSFLATGHPYTPDPNAPELSGQFRYPPPALYLFVPFVFLPGVLWWAIPLAVSAWIIAWWRPAMWSWPLIALAFMNGHFAVTVGAGNTDIWVLMVIALASRWPAASWLLVAKPTALPFVLPFIRHRSWWIGLLAAAAVSLLLLPLWSEWLSVVPLYRGSQGPLWLYGWVNWPVLAVPLLARFASTRHPIRRRASSPAAPGSAPSPHRTASGPAGSA